MESDYTICKNVVYIHSNGSRPGSDSFLSELGSLGTTGGAPPDGVGPTTPICCIALITASVAASVTALTIW